MGGRRSPARVPAGPRSILPVIGKMSCPSLSEHRDSHLNRCLFEAFARKIFGVVLVFSAVPVGPDTRQYIGRSGWGKTSGNTRSGVGIRPCRAQAPWGFLRVCRPCALWRISARCCKKPRCKKPRLLGKLRAGPGPTARPRAIAHCRTAFGRHV